MSFVIDSNYPSIAHLRQRAQQRMPKFAFDYLIEGCNDDISVNKNHSALQQIELMPQYLSPYSGSDITVDIFGKRYAAPFGVSAVGLQSLMWPNSSQILASAAQQANIPFMLSTVTTMSIETAGKLTAGNFWFQLYRPKDDVVTADLLKRAADSGCEVLVLLADVPTFGYRPRDIYNGLGIPPKMKLRNILQMLTHPAWALAMLRAGGMPKFATMQKYMPSGLSLKELGQLMDDIFDGRLDTDKIAALRDMWPGKMVLKGVSSVADARSAAKLGLDGIIVSNHGGRQLDAAPATIKSLQLIAASCKDKLKIFFDGGARSGVDVARAIACGADAVFMGRPFMFASAALGERGGEQAISIIEREFLQVMQQVCCERVADLPKFLHQG